MMNLKTLFFIFSLCLFTSARAKVVGDTVTLGSAVSLTGKYSPNGIHTQNGYDFAVKAINRAGGIKIAGKKYKLKIVYYDDESTPARTAQLLERLINQDKVKYMLGPYGSSSTKAAAAITEKYKIPMVEAEGASRSLFTQGYRYLFAVLTTSEQYLSGAVHLAADQAKKEGRDPSKLKVALAFENDPFSMDVRVGVLEVIKKYKMRVVVDDKLPRELTDMSATLTKVKVLKPDLLVVSGHSKGAVLAARQINDFKITVPIIAITHCESSKIIEKFGSGVNDFLCATQWSETMKYRDPLFGSASEFDENFKKAFAGYNNVPYQSAQAAAAVYVWKDAFERAQSFDTEKVRQALAATDLQTFYGPIKFSPKGNNIAKKMALRQIQNGLYKVVSPQEFASSTIKYPGQSR